MNRRHLFKQAVAVAAVAATFPGTVFAQRTPQAGKEFKVINPAQPVESGNKIEVIEFFSYGCPHCHEFEPTLAAWAKRLPQDVMYRKVPITFNRDAWADLAKVYLTLELMGETERLTPLVFTAVQVDRVNFSDEAARNAWLQKNGVNAAKFNETYKSFTVASKLQRATQVAAAYQIQGVPTIAVDGKFMTAPSMVNSFEGTLAVTDHLIAQARSQRGRK